jgi:PAS domain S-box-containing protein
MKNILLIEDDKNLRDNTAELLKEEGFRVFLAEDGLVGVQLTMKYYPDLILCDINLPVMNGYDFFKTIQQIKSTSTIPLIYVTGKTEKEDQRAGMQLGAEDYITKPYNFDELLRVVNMRLTKFDNIVQNNDEKFFALIDNPTIGVYIYQEDKFIYYNNALADILGYTYEEFQNLNFNDIIADEYKKEIMGKIHFCFNEIQNSLLIEFEGIHKSNKRLSLELYGTVRSYKGKSSLIGNIANIGKEFKYLTQLKTHTNNIHHLSKREIEVLILICKGKSTHDIANEFGLSQRTVDSHRANLLKKSSSKNTAELVMYAIKHNLFSMGQ